MPKPDLPEIDREQAVEATAWFAALMARVRAHDAAGSREAIDALAKQGVRVKFHQGKEGRRDAS
jgi:hypothetical protein